jgi:hypothetical protein
MPRSDDVTTDFADGYRAARHAAATELRRQAQEIRNKAGGCAVALSNASAMEIAAGAIARMQIPPARREPTGLEVRGG